MVLGAPTSTDSPTLGPLAPRPGNCLVKLADAGEQSFQGVALHLARGIVDDRPIQPGEPLEHRVRLMYSS